eukprot:1166593-Pyramimonas_sp.AAC.1
MHQGSFYQTFLEGLYLVVRASTVRWTERDEMRPSDVDAKHAEAVLELCWYGRDLHVIYNTSDDEIKHRVEQTQRLTDGKRLLEVCQGSWCSNHIHHWSRGGCCSNEAEAASEIFDAMVRVIGHVVPVPALNKWTQVYPVVSQIALGGCLHNVMPRAMEYGHTLAVPEAASDIQERDPHGDDDGALVGLPRDERKAREREKQARSSKSLNWIKHNNTLVTLLIWLCIARHVMALHYFLFRDCTSIHYEAPNNSDMPHPVFDFTSPSGSRAKKAVSSLVLLLVHGSASALSGWQAIHGQFGSRWPDGSVDMARSGLLLVIGQLWRRLVWYFHRPPWRLASICNKDLSMEELGRDTWCARAHA